MAESNFFVKDAKGKLVAAKYLYYDGTPVVDPNLSIAKAMLLYDASGDILPTQNLNGYLIVPADYTIQEAISFAQSVSEEMTFATEFPGGDEVSGLPTALEMMALAFPSNHSQDLQTAYNGKTGQPFVKAFTDAASFHLGFVSAYAGIPLSQTEEGGGLYNKLKKIFGADVNTSGTHDLSLQNAISIPAGYKFGLELRDAQHQADEKPMVAAGAPSDQTELSTGWPDHWVLNPSSNNPGESFQQGTDGAYEWSIDGSDFSVRPANLSGAKSGREEVNNPFNLGRGFGNIDTLDPVGGSTPYKSLEPASLKPAARHTTTALDLQDAYAKVFANMGGQLPGENTPDWGAQHVSGAAGLHNQMNAVAEALFRAEREAPQNLSAHGASANTPATPKPDRSASPAPSAVQVNQETIALAAALYRAIHGEAPAPNGQDAGAHRRHGPTGHRDDPIFIHPNGNLGSRRTVNLRSPSVSPLP